MSMKGCFASVNQETNVSSKSGGSNRETTYVQKVAENQVQDPSNYKGKGTPETDSGKKVLISNNGNQPIVLVSRPNGQLTSDGPKGDVNPPNGTLKADKTLSTDSSNEETLLNPQPEWFTNLDGVSRGKVRELCEQAGPPPSDSERIDKLRTLFNIDLGQALEVNELYHSGRLRGESRVMLKSILKTSTGSLRSLSENGSAAPTISRRLSWIDETGGKLAQKREMKTWHYMNSSRRSNPNICCQIL